MGVLMGSLVITGDSYQPHFLTSICDINVYYLDETYSPSGRLLGIFYISNSNIRP